MPSIHPDYEYDIFISYRQNDNKRDAWVTNFVDVLRDELEATLKNPISIYFDENPHDGLLETHQVDASLAKKLKCLVFIPIISQTYCDESSFAWEHEFLPFINMAKEDELGMNITLSNGNVTSRVLPVKIHDLDTEDQHTLEAILDGPLRSIDFIFQQPGVNRPLRAKEDDSNSNLNKTFYRDQINKVANALKDIGLSILNQSEGRVTIPTVKEESPPETRSNKKGLAIGLGIIALAMIFYWSYTQFYNSPVAEVEDVSLAVLAFDDQSPNGDQEWLGDGMADEILNVLAKVNGLQVTGKTSSFSFKGKNATIKEIGEALDVKTVLEGSVSRVGNNLRITAQLIDVETDKHIWSKKYDRDWGEIHSIIDEVAQTISSSLITELSIEELEEIRAAYEVNPEAYEYYLRGDKLHKKFWDNSSDEIFMQAEKLLIKAISVDASYGDAYGGLADLYDSRGNNPSYRNRYWKKRDSIVNTAYKITPNSPYVLTMKGLAFSKVYNQDRNWDSAFFYYKKAYDLDSNHIQVNSFIASDFYGVLGLYKKANSLFRKVLKFDPLNTTARVILAQFLEANGNNDQAKIQVEKILDFDENHFQANTLLFYLSLMVDKDTIQARKLYNTLQHVPNSNYRKALLLAIEGRKEEALDTFPFPERTLYSLLDMKKEAIDLANSHSTKSNYTYRWTYNSLVNDGSYDFIRNTPEFQKILVEAKRVHEERVAKYSHLFDEE